MNDRYQLNYNNNVIGRLLFLNMLESADILTCCQIRHRKKSGTRNLVLLGFLIYCLDVHVPDFFLLQTSWLIKLRMTEAAQIFVFL